MNKEQALEIATRASQDGVPDAAAARQESASSNSGRPSMAGVQRHQNCDAAEISPKFPGRNTASTRTLDDQSQHEETAVRDRLEAKATSYALTEPSTGATATSQTDISRESHEV